MKIDGYVITFSKPNWSIKQIETAYCLGFDVGSKEIKADLRITSKKALKNFMRMCYSSFPKNIIHQLKDVYDRVDSEFDEIYLPELKYPNYDLRDHQINALKEMAHRQFNLLAYKDRDWETDFVKLRIYSVVHIL